MTKHKDFQFSSFFILKGEGQHDMCYKIKRKIREKKEKNCKLVEHIILFYTFTDILYIYICGCKSY